MKKILSSVLAAAMVVSVASISVFAAPASTTAMDGDGVPLANIAVSSTGIVADPVVPGKTFYVKLGSASATDIVGGAELIGSVDATLTAVQLENLVNSDYFKFKLDKDEGSKYISSVTLYTDKNLDSAGRTSYLKFVLNDSQTTSELKSSGKITFTAKADSDSYTGSKAVTAATNIWKKGDVYTIPYTLWINNDEVGNDDNPDTGDRVYIKPEKNETNTIVWGDDRAALTFESNDDATKFYARLNTSNDAAIWREYADPVDADLWFYNFVGNSTIPATSRATLTLGIPWDDDDDYAIDPEDAYIYEKDADGRLIDVTSKFTYSEDDAEIPGWSIKTRTLGTYIVSDTELDLDIEDEDEDVSEAEETGKTTTGAKPIPDTGASDMVNVAVVAGIVSLAAAGAVAFRKAK